MTVPGDGEAGDVGVEGDGDKVQGPRGAGDAQTEGKEMDYPVEAALDFWAKTYCEIYLQQFTI